LDGKSALDPYLTKKASLIQSSGLYKIAFADLTIGQELSRGCFGVIYETSYHCKGERIPVAAKKIHEVLLESQLEKEAFEREILLGCQLVHPNIVKTFGYSEKDGLLTLVMQRESSSLKVLFDHMRKKTLSFSPQHITKLCIDLCEGMTYLHSKNIIHRDMNCGNFLLSSDWTLKISDFGTTKEMDENLARNTMTLNIGAPYYLSPEARTGHYTFSRDVWSFGLIVADFCALPASVPHVSKPSSSTLKIEFKRLKKAFGDEDGKRVQSYWKKCEVISKMEIVEYLLKREKALDMMKETIGFEKICRPCLYFETETGKVARPSFDVLKDQFIVLQKSKRWDSSMPTKTVEEFFT